MKILKYLLFLILIVIIGGSIYFGTKDGSFDAAETRTIQAPSQVIYDNIKDFKNWESWGPWMAEDPDLEFAYAEKTEGEGASYSWKSEVMGDGSMQTVKVIPGKEIGQKITFNTPMGDSESDVYWRLEPSEDGTGTDVTWGMKGEHSFMEKVFMAFASEDMETSIKQMYEVGLTKLDSTVQESMKQYTINVDGITDYSGGFYMYVTTAAKQSELSTRMGQMYGQIMGFMTQNNIQPSGMPFTVYHEIDDPNGTLIFSAGIPVRERIITPEGSPVVCGFMDKVTALKTTLKGNYTNISTAYETAKEYMAQNKITADPNGNMFEIYANDPGEVPNPADWITEIFIPIVVQEDPGQ